MKKIIILAGNGELPYNLAKELEKRKLDFFIITFKNNKVILLIEIYEKNFTEVNYYLKIIKNQ